MSRYRGRLSRAQLISGAMATGALAACGGGNTATPTPASTATCGIVPASQSQDRFGLSKILSDKVFDGIDKKALSANFDPSTQIDASTQGYFAQSGQQPQTGNVIQQIPSQGIVIQSPGTYTFGGNILWRPNGVTCSAITIQSSNVTLDLAGFTLTASVSDTSQMNAGIVVVGGNSNITIQNGTVAGVSEYGILAAHACGLNISAITVTGLCMQNLNIRLLTPAGIYVTGSTDVAISNCSVTQSNVTTDSSAGIQLIGTSNATVTGCHVSGLVNNDGAVQAFSLIRCTAVTTTACEADTLQSHFNGNILTTGHTVLGFCPIFCYHISYVNCSATGLTGCCDDCHGMSVFLDSDVTVTGFQANNVLDGVAQSNTGAKATGLEVYGEKVTLTNCVVNGIKAINPQDKQAAGFSAWGTQIQFQGCQANNVTVQDDVGGGSFGTGFGWAPDPRPEFAYIGAYFVTYTDCTANQCDVGFDTWYHVFSTWTRPVTTNCTTPILVQPGGTRTVSADACSECTVPITVKLTNFAFGNTYPS